VEGLESKQEVLFCGRIRAGRLLEEGTGMLVDRYDPEDVFARVPEVAKQTDPVLKP
jgi:hypothetical protein